MSDDGRESDDEFFFTDRSIGHTGLVIVEEEECPIPFSVRTPDTRVITIPDENKKVIAFYENENNSFPRTQSNHAIQ